MTWKSWTDARRVGQARVAEVQPPLQHIKLWLCLGLGACAVFVYGCLMHHPPGDPGIPHFDKFQHGGAFVVLAAWFGALLRPRYWVVFVLLGLFGVFTEYLQSMTAYRNGDAFDWLADATGALIGLVLVRFGAMNWLRKVDARVTTAGNHAG